MRFNLTPQCAWSGNEELLQNDEGSYDTTPDLEMRSNAVDMGLSSSESDSDDDHLHMVGLTHAVTREVDSRQDMELRHENPNKSSDWATLIDPA